MRNVLYRHDTIRCLQPTVKFRSKSGIDFRARAKT